MGRHDSSELLRRASNGDRTALGRLASVVDQQGREAEEVDDLLISKRGNSWVVGVTGPPGAGKSTLVDRLISAERASHRSVAVLAIDPTSPFSGGAILGDRVRMASNLGDDEVFIRSLATRGALGGLTTSVASLLRLCDVVGFDTVIVETVGVGQVELDIAGVADTVVVVLTPGWGDEVQAAKAGLMEIADVFVVNKADRPGAAQTAGDVTSMMGLARARADGWLPPVAMASALHGDGIDAVRTCLEEHRVSSQASGSFQQRRRRRTERELHARVVARLARRAEEVCSGPLWEALVDEALSGARTPGSIAEELVE